MVLLPPAWVRTTCPVKREILQIHRENHIRLTSSKSQARMQIMFLCLWSWAIKSGFYRQFFPEYIQKFELTWTISLTLGACTERSQPFFVPIWLYEARWRENKFYSSCPTLFQFINWTAECPDRFEDKSYYLYVTTLIPGVSGTSITPETNLWEK